MKRRNVGSVLSFATLGVIAWLCFNWFNTHPLEDKRSVGSLGSENAGSSHYRGKTARLVHESPSPRLGGPEAIFPKDSPASSDPVERTVAVATILDQRVEPFSSHSMKRTRLVTSGILPHPLLVQEEWTSSVAGTGWRCSKRELFLADQLIVKLRAPVSHDRLAATLARLEMDFVDFIAPEICTVRLRESGMEAVPRAVAALSALTDLVEGAEADGVGFGGAIPNDPYFGNQWGVHNTGQSGGTANADVDGPELWDFLGTAPGVVVAVLDSGLNFTHPDLQGIAWTNTADIPGDGLDNDGNGYVDDYRGWDFTNSDNDPTDDHGHGSNVSGIIAANRDNGTGIAGMIGGVKILVCKVLNASNAGTTSALIAATTYARWMGAPIMHISLQSYPFSSTLNTEFNACQSAGIFLSICAGNQGVNNDVTPNYPSCYQQTNIIAVGNHDRTDVRWSGASNPSNYGPTNVDLFAPGRQILAPVLGTSYSFYTGTSQAAPFVTAVAAAIKYLNPAWNANAIRSNILNSVIKRPAYDGICVTGGRLNAVTAVGSAIRREPANDRDADESSNLLEYLAGTRLDDGASRPEISGVSVGGNFHLRMPRVIRPGAHLEVVLSTDLANWSTAGVMDFSTTNLLDQAVSVDTSPVGFLRVRGTLNP